MKQVYKYHGFEDVCDMFRDMQELFEFEPFNKLDGHFSGTLTITVEYNEPSSNPPEDML